MLTKNVLVIPHSEEYGTAWRGEEENGNYLPKRQENSMVIQQFFNASTKSSHSLKLLYYKHKIHSTNQTL